MPSDYENRIRRVVRHIFDNPAGDLSLDALADVAAMSRFHWHRVFHAMTGETTAQAVRRIRVHRASVWLMQSDRPVERIARDCGYDNAQSFARAFKAQTGHSPAAFRALGRASPDPVHLKTGASPMIPFEIKDIPDRRLVGLPHKGAYYLIGRAFDQVGTVFGGQKWWPDAVGMIAIYYDSPAEVAEPDLTSFAGVVVRDDFTLSGELEELILPGGQHLIATYKGPYAGLPQAWDDVYCNALPQSRAIPADRAPFESYLNSMLDTAPEDLLTEICVPLAKHGG